MGTPALAAHILVRLAAAPDPRFRVVAVVTRPDEPKGRGMSMAPSEVGAAAARLAIPVLKPLRIKSPEFLDELKSYQPDLLVVAAYGRILPQSILDLPRIMPLNVHASLLPRHRGAAPVEAAILAGDSTTGVTIMRMVAQMDAGPTILKREIAIAPDDTQATLKNKLAELGASALLEALDLVAGGKAVETPQDESAATYTRPITRHDAIIEWSRDAQTIERTIRAFDPWPVARTSLKGEPLMIWKARVEEAVSAGPHSPGTIVAVKPDPLVQCGCGRLALLEVQAPGRKRMKARDFLNGRRIGVLARLGS